ncbi:cardiolipin synthase [Vibrio sp. HA2012]|uniref:cardiolipin synthase n=1 Tax=Vibrio sp. HA2012 TaxID=1971595 RepID=UPI000C2C4968|nr:cardiolipin synthase [Vibrio sp. HA2012]PJC87868.1 cardiolipin synthase [Vibrio sp. HA2012]
MEKFYHIITLISVLTYWMLVAGVTIRVVMKRSSVSVSLAWLMIIYILPVFGVIFYFLIGELNLGRTRAERAQKMFNRYQSWFNDLYNCQAHVPEMMCAPIKKIDDLCTHRMGIPALCGNTLTLQSDPDQILRSIMQDIQNAKFQIRIEFYIWHQGGLADAVAAALIRAAKRGVNVKILLDSAGSHYFFNSHWVGMFESAGIDIIQALKVTPLRMFFRRLDIRQHRKIITIDDEIAYTGSMNMVDPAFFKQDAGVGEWVDVIVRITGPTVNILSAIHAWDWEVETGTRVLPCQPICQLNGNKCLPVQVIPSGPGMPENLIQQALILAINQAEKSVRITTPYFVPSEELLETIKTTAQRGIKTELIIPHKNDSLMVQWASKAYYAELLDAGVEIYEFFGGLLHTKSVVIDENYCLVGTVNLDMRSLWLNFEVTLAVDDGTFTQNLYHLQTSYIGQAFRVDAEQWRNRTLMHKFQERLFSLFGPLL